jgi:AAA15 family ATPase/GTPase
MSIEGLAMLIEFRVEDHRSLRDEQVLTMEEGQGGDPDDVRARDAAGEKKGLLPVAAVYGANASGKSNVLDAFAFMHDAVALSHRSWPPNAGVPRSPFAWGGKRREPSLFETSITLAGVRYQYGFSANDERFLEEWLYAWPSKRKQTWFKREGGAFSFSPNLKGENKLIESVTRPNALFLSAAAQHRHQQLAPISSWFDRIQIINLPRSALYSLPASLQASASADALSILAELPAAPGPKKSGVPGFDLDSLRGRLRGLLREADVGIVDFRFVQPTPDSAPGDRKPARVQFAHQLKINDSWLPFEQESKGTQMLFNMGVFILLTLERGGMLLIDELEASLHPAIGRRIVGLFNDPKTNPLNAQLIFTTHDTNLLGASLGELVLRRDQVWLTEKDDAGATVLYPLTDFKPRKAENIERGYLQGRYGAVPFLGDFVAVGE